MNECPQKFIGNELIEDINTVDACQNGVMPVGGGLMDQSVYYLELTSRLRNERAKIEREQAERRRRQ